MTNQIKEAIVGKVNACTLRDQLYDSLINEASLCLDAFDAFKQLGMIRVANDALTLGNEYMQYADRIKNAPFLTVIDVWAQVDEHREWRIDAHAKMIESLKRAQGEVLCKKQRQIEVQRAANRLVYCIA